MRLQPIGAILRAVVGAALVSKPDREMRAAIERLNAVSDAIIADGTDRAASVDDLARSR